MGEACCPVKYNRCIVAWLNLIKHPICCAPVIIIVSSLLTYYLFFGVPYLISFQQATPNFKVRSVSVTLPNIRNISSYATSPPSPLLGANWNISLSIYNSYMSNDYLYERVEPRVMYHNVSLARTWMLPFYLPCEGRRFLVNLATISTPLHRSLMDSIVSDWRSGVVEFTVVVRATARIERIFGGRSKKKTKVVTCENVKVAFLPNSTQGIMVEIAEHRECPILGLRDDKLISDNGFFSY